MKFLVIFLAVMLGCKEYKENRFLGKWCYADKDSDLTVTIFEKGDSTYLKYSYVMDGGQRINQTLDHHSGAIHKNKAFNEKLTFKVTDEYKKALNYGIETSSDIEVMLTISTGGTVEWRDVSADKSSYLPQLVLLQHCK